MTSKLPILDPLQPIARCGHCYRPVYAKGTCQCPQPASGWFGMPTYPHSIIPKECPLRDPDWQWKVERQAFEVYEDDKFFGSSDD
jgi:hypothetical protein